MKLILIVFCMFLWLPLKAQEAFEGLKADTSKLEVKRLDETAIENYKLQPEFNYQEIIFNQDLEPSRFERIINWLNRNFLKLLEWIFGVEQASGIFSFILQALPYIFGLLVLYLLIKFFVDRNTTDFISTVKNRKHIKDSEEEELIKNADLNALLEKAISENNYRDAVRYSYLIILKQLDSAQLILWEQQKTNEDFIKEISSQNIREAFEENTRLYDFVWYGDFGLTRDEFIKAQSDFQITHSLINSRK